MRRGDIEAMYRAYGPAILRRARAILGDDQLAQDVMHEVFVKAIRQGDRFRGEASPMTWLYRVATNACLNHLRDEATRARLLASEARNATTTPSSDADARLAIRRVLDRVPAELCEIAIYYYVDHMNQDEIASVVGVSRRTIGNRLDEFRAAASAATADPVPAPGGADDAPEDRS